MFRVGPRHEKISSNHPRLQQQEESNSREIMGKIISTNLPSIPDGLLTANPYQFTTTSKKGHLRTYRQIMHHDIFDFMHLQFSLAGK